MSSPFQKQFSSKNPITAPLPSPLNGNYYSGVDGLQYVSPKIPESKTPAEPSKKTKTPEIPKTTTAREELKPVGVESVGITVQNELPTAEIPKTSVDVIKNRTKVNQRPTYRQAWDADLEGVKGKYTDYESYVNDRTGQRTVDPGGYEKDLFVKTNLKTPGTEEVYYQQKNDEDEVEIGRNFFRGKEFKI